jgi:DNA-binding Lrp family transcriptional regulator
MSKERDHGSGRYVEKATLDDVLDAVDAVDGPPVATTADVADATGISRDTARRKLEKLRENGRVERRETAGRAMLYWPVDESSDEQTPAERREAGESTVQSDDVRDTGTATVDATHSTLPDTLAILTVDVGRDELPGSDDKLDERIDALQAVVAYLVEHGTATRDDFQSDVYPDHPARYTNGKDPAYSWWTNAMYPALSELADHAEAIQEADTSGEWVFSPES